ncbi:MAG: CBS domain-containing protein, partial [Vampirovibrio sp.]|nr:CBS domain-containing protein [Vampirovibrio sp.]
MTVMTLFRAYFGLTYFGLGKLVKQEVDGMSPQTLQTLGDKIRRFLALKNGSALRRLLARHNFADVAEVFEHELSEDEATTCFQYLTISQAAAVLISLSDVRRKSCLDTMTDLRASRIFRYMPADDAADILQEMDAEERRKILAEMPYDADTRTLQHLMLEEPDSAAGLMSPDFIMVSIQATVGEAMQVIRRADPQDFIYYVYLVNDENKLVGVVSLKTLILQEESLALEKVAEFDVKSILVSYDQELVANLFRKYYNLLAMPVVDPEEVLQGIITLDDVVEVIEEETAEDMYLSSGIHLEEMDERHLLTGPVTDAVKARMPWLAITVVGQLFAAMVIASYAETVAAAVIAVSFMPLLTGLTGN